MAKVHGPSFSRATMLYVAIGLIWFWSKTPSGRSGHPSHAVVALLVTAMIAGPVALVNFWNIVWGSFKTVRSVPLFVLELIYAAIVPGLLFVWQLLHLIQKI